MTQTAQDSSPSPTPHEWLRTVCPDLYALAMQYEQVEDWCLEPDLDPGARSLIEQFTTLLSHSPGVVGHLSGLTYFLGHCHTALSLQLLDLASKFDPKLADHLLMFARDCIAQHHELEPEAKVLIDRLYRLAVNAHFSRLFCPPTRLAVMAAMRERGD